MISRHVTLVAVDDAAFTKIREIFENKNSITVINGHNTDEPISKEFFNNEKIARINMDNVDRSQNPFGLYSAVKDELKENGLTIIYTEHASGRHTVGTNAQADEYWQRQIGRPLIIG